MSEKKWVSGGPYDDIINLPHHVSTEHLPMPLEARAAQFAPFAALTGFEDVLDDTAEASIKRTAEEIEHEDFEET